MAAISSSNLSNDQEKFLSAKLIARATLKMVAASLCEKVKQPQGSGKTAYFIRYSRMNVPLETLTEGTTPTESTFSIEQFSVTLDQWGDVLIITDVAKLTTKHPVIDEAQKLLADNAQRVIDREVQLVWLANTNVQYGDGSVTTRATVTAAMKISDSVLHKARITMQLAGAPERDGPSMDYSTGSGGTNKIGKGSYVAVCGPEVMADIMATSTSLGTFASVDTYSGGQALYNGEFGKWQGFRWVMSNFIPEFNILGGTTAAVVSGASFGTNTPVVTAVDGGGALTSATTYYYKVTRKSKTRGFEEDISIRHSTASTATANNESFTFDFSSLTAGYVFNVYFGATDADASLFLHATDNIEVGATLTVTAVPSSSGATAPANCNTTGSPSIYPVYIHAAESCKWVGLADLKTYLTGGSSSDSDPLAQRYKLGYKFLGKTLVPDSTRLLRLEVASTY